MKTFMLTSGILLVIVGVIITQSICMHRFKADICEILPRLEEAYAESDKKKFSEIADELGAVWEKVQTWFAVTVDTRSIEDIDLAMKRLVKYGELGDSFDFYAEMINLEGMVSRLPRREGAYVRELL